MVIKRILAREENKQQPKVENKNPFILIYRVFTLPVGELVHALFLFFSSPAAGGLGSSRSCKFERKEYG